MTFSQTALLVQRIKEDEPELAITYTIKQAARLCAEHGTDLADFLCENDLLTARVNSSGLVDAASLFDFLGY